MCNVQSSCGLPITTYFSAVKLRWLLDNSDNVRQAADEGRAMFGTVDSWLLWVRMPFAFGLPINRVMFVFTVTSVKNTGRSKGLAKLVSKYVYTLIIGNIRTQTVAVIFIVLIMSVSNVCMTVIYTISKNTNNISK